MPYCDPQFWAVLQICEPLVQPDHPTLLTAMIWKSEPAWLL